MTYFLQNYYFGANDAFKTVSEFGIGAFKTAHYKDTNAFKWLSTVQPQHITKSLLISYVIATLFQVLYNNIPETVFLNLAIYLFWLFLNLINILYNVFIPFCLIWFSVSLVIYNNPIFSLLGLIFVFFNMILVLLSLKIEFLAMIFLIVYIGAISILFLFVIMLFNLKKIYNWRALKFYHIISLIIALCLFFKLYYVVANFFQTTFNNDLSSQSYLFVYLKSLTNSVIYFEDIIAIGASMYTATVTIFLAVGYILLVAMIGAIILALSTVKQKRNIPKIDFK